MDRCSLCGCHFLEGEKTIEVPGLDRHTDMLVCVNRLRNYLNRARELLVERWLAGDLTEEEDRVLWELNEMVGVKK